MDDEILPPDTELLAWGSMMGPEELAAFDHVREVLVQAIASGALRPGTAGWKTAADGLSRLALLGPVPGTPTDSRLQRIHEERLRLWVELASPIALRQLRGRLAPLIAPEIRPPSE